MRDVFQALLSACAKQGGVLVTVVRQEGSAPRHAGACMAVGPEGRLAGTIGGGAMERSAIGQARAHLLEKKSTLGRFDLSDAGQEPGMVCGGNAEVLYTYLPPTDDALRVLSLAEACLQTQTPGRLVLPLAGGAGFLDSRGELTGLAGPDPSSLDAASGLVSDNGEQYFVLPLTNPGTVRIIGGGHLAQALARLLPWLDFAYDVADDRQEYADPKRFPGARQVRALPYTDLGKLDVGPDDAIVILTDGHRGDYEAEKWALGTPAGYIGVVGSRKKTAHVEGLLRQDGFTEEDLVRVAAPIGIPIGSDTPPEIAVSIAAQLIEYRARKRGSAITT